MRDAPALDADPRRRLLLDLYAAGCAAVNGRRTVRAALAGFPADEPVAVVAVGKAAGAMALGAVDALGGRLERGLVISRAGHLDAELANWPALECLTGDHPLPGAASLAAGARLLEFVRALPRDRRLLVLVSGGASSLVEVLLPGVTLEDLAAVGGWAIASGEPIDVVNAARTRLSALKGGRFAAALAERPAEALLLSDVPGDAPAVIGSGLVAAGGGATPPWLVARLAALPPPPPGATLPARVIATLEDALAAMVRVAEARGLAVRVLAGRAAGSVTTAASRFAHELVMTPEDVLLWGGETVVALPAEPGRGGRNQHFALAAATLIAGYADLALLAAGSDGSDGNTEDAGAIVDGGTIARGAASGLEPEAALAAANAAAYLGAAGDLVHTGPTGTNVGDLMIGLRGRPEALMEER